MLRALTGFEGTPDPDHIALKQSVDELRQKGCSFPEIATAIVFGSTWYEPSKICEWRTSHNGLPHQLCKEYGVAPRGVFFQLCKTPGLDINLLKATIELAQKLSPPYVQFGPPSSINSS